MSKVTKRYDTSEKFGFEVSEIVDVNEIRTINELVLPE
jgi:hypothetical protein